MVEGLTCALLDLPLISIASHPPALIVALFPILFLLWITELLLLVPEKHFRENSLAYLNFDPLVFALCMQHKSVLCTLRNDKRPC